jgi:hypothetical protein
VVVEDVRLHPARVPIGGRVSISFALRSRARRPQDLLVDVSVSFVKASGRAVPKIFKVKRLTLAPGARVELRTSVSLAVHTTRTPRPGAHAVHIIVNGHRTSAGSFQVTPLRA